jgi:hypothetical protein
MQPFNIYYYYYLGIFLVLTQRYGRDGQNSKKFEDKALIFDFHFLQSIAEETFIKTYMSSLNSFVLLLNEVSKTGKKKKN